MSRIVDRGAVVAAYVGIGMALTIGVSFLLTIPIEPIYWLLSPLSGLLIGYYANQRSDRRAGPLGRIVANASFAGLVTGLTFALLLLGVKALFFYADNGYRDQSLGGPISCRGGASCVYARYLAEKDGPARLAAAGVTGVDAFSEFYWSQQAQTAGTLLLVTFLGALGGGLVYAVARPRSPAKLVPPATPLPPAPLPD